MSRMLAALKRLESQQPRSGCAEMSCERDAFDETQVIRVPMPAAAGRATGLSSHVLWQPAELETTVAPPAIRSEPVAIDIAPDAVPIEPVQKEEPQHDILRNEVLSNEALRSLASLLLRKLRGGLPGAIAVASLGDAADASRFVADISKIFCQTESLRVLAIDAQSGCRTQRESSALAEALTQPERLHDAVQATAVEGLGMLSGGIGTAVNTRSFASLFRSCSSDFDLVLVDGGVASNAATRPLAAACDGTVLVARLGETDTRDARRSIKSLHKAGASLLGCVLLGANL